MRLLAYCLLPNHWHLVVWPRHDGELSDFGHWLTLTHTQRWHAHYHDLGGGHLYQGVPGSCAGRKCGAGVACGSGLKSLGRRSGF
jgi:hypothetical protein